jgi:heavy metal sensor kinase
VSVRVRLTLWNVVVFTVVLGLLGLLLRERVHARLEAAVDRELAQRARMIPDRLPGPLSEMIERLRQERQRSGRPGGPVGRPFPPPLYGLNGKNLLTDAPVPDKEALRRAISTREPLFTTHGDSRVYTMPLPRTGRVEGVYQISESLSTVQEDVAKLTQTLVALLPVALLVIAVGSLLLVERALGPVRDITRATAEIEASDLSHRLPVEGRDEFARLAGTFNGMLARLEDAFARERQFAADASHELKTPLTIIKANTSLALADPALSDDARETLAEIDGAVDRTIRIVRDLLLLTRADATRLALAKQRLNVHDLLESVAADAPKLREDGAPVIVKAAADLTAVADPHYLQQMLINLLTNALRHTPSTGRITLYGDRDSEGETLILRVRDTGTGIAPEHLARLGERFYRADAARARREGGTGLGLAICRAIAEGHGGSLRVESILGEGTTVTIWLPLS